MLKSWLWLTARLSAWRAASPGSANLNYKGKAISADTGLWPGLSAVKIDLSLWMSVPSNEDNQNWNGWDVANCLGWL